LTARLKSRALSKLFIRQVPATKVESLVARLQDQIYWPTGALLQTLAA
jgi:hypothetical protein